MPDQMETIHWSLSREARISRRDNTRGGCAISVADLATRPTAVEDLSAVVQGRGCCCHCRCLYRQHRFQGTDAAIKSGLDRVQDTAGKHGCGSPGESDLVIAGANNVLVQARRRGASHRSCSQCPPTKLHGRDPNRLFPAWP